MRRAEVAGRRRYDGSGTPADLDKVQPLGARGDIRAYFGGMLLATGMPHHLVGSTLIWFLARERTGGLWSRPHEGARGGKSQGSTQHRTPGEIGHGRLLHFVGTVDLNSRARFALYASERLRDPGVGAPEGWGDPTVRVFAAVRCRDTTSDDTCQAGINRYKTEARGPTACRSRGLTQR